MGWKLSLNESFAASYQQIQQQWEPYGEKFGLTCLDEWFSMAINQSIAKHPSLSTLYNQLTANYPLLIHSHKN